MIQPMSFTHWTKQRRTDTVTAKRQNIVLYDFVAWSMGALTVYLLVIALVQAWKRDGEDEQ
ncbi:MAG: hypothetical protein Tp136SUR676911_27 [Prokaryotic dsDNA virus sp.]|nr:MAG: hypothetical protein Tp136SUR676911_27 [Prokaryotic dsDNA virus sp.]